MQARPFLIFQSLVGYACINSTKKYHLFLALQTLPFLPSLHLFFADKPGRRQKLDSGCIWQWYMDGFGSGLHDCLQEGGKPSICCEVKAGPHLSCSDLVYRCGRLWKRPLVVSRPCPGLQASWNRSREREKMQLSGEQGTGSVGEVWGDKSVCSSYGRVFIMRGNLLVVGTRLPAEPQMWWKDQEREGTCATSHWTFLGCKESVFLIQKSGFIFSTYTVSRSSFEQSYCHSAFLCSKKQNDAALPMNSWRPSLLCDTLHMNLRATLAVIPRVVTAPPGAAVNVTTIGLWSTRCLTCSSMGMRVIFQSAQVLLGMVKGIHVLKGP